eukprot:scaffold285_cov330-Pavlova_lutheri.AAC.51
MDAHDRVGRDGTGGFRREGLIGDHRRRKEGIGRERGRVQTMEFIPREGSSVGKDPILQHRDAGIHAWCARTCTANPPTHNTQLDVGARQEQGTP